MLNYDHDSDSLLESNNDEKGMSNVADYFSMIQRVPLLENVFIVRVFYGGCNFQRTSIHHCIRKVACNIYPRELRIEMEGNEGFKKSRGGAFSEYDLSDWLAESHFHIVACHPHQATKFNWSAAVLYNALKRKLFMHPGFPYMREWNDPSFTQNKFVYLAALGGLLLYANTTY